MTVASESTPVFLLAENRLLREALARIFSKKHDLEVVGAVSCTPDVLQVIANCSPRVLVFDPADMRSGLAFLRKLRELLPELRVILIGMETSTELVVQAIREGVAGFMLMEATAAEIVAAVRCVIGGGAVCPPELCQALFSYVASQRPTLPSFEAQEELGLSRREQQLVKMVGQGLTNKEIAAQLNLSEQTVKNHLHRMLRKMGVRSRLQVVTTCRDHGFLSV